MWLTCWLIRQRWGVPARLLLYLILSGREIREGTRKLQVDAKGILMHIDRSHEIAMAAKPAVAADPVSSPGLMFMRASGTPAAGSSFGASEAPDARLLAFVGEIVDVIAVFPLRHPAIVMASAISIADAVRVADEERPDLAVPRRSRSPPWWPCA